MPACNRPTGSTPDACDYTQIPYGSAQLPDASPQSRRQCTRTLFQHTLTYQDASGVMERVPVLSQRRQRANPWQHTPYRQNRTVHCERAQHAAAGVQWQHRTQRRYRTGRSKSAESSIGDASAGNGIATT
eukprot:2052545-Rhodomonas_salina.2